MDASWVIPSLERFAPELVLVATIILVVLVDLFPRCRGMVVGISIFGLLAAIAALAWNYSLTFEPDSAEATFLGSYAFDRYSLFFKAAFLVATLIVVIFSAPVVRKWETARGEYFALMLSCTFGMCLMAGANDLLMMYLALEFVSVTSYIMAGLLRRNRRSSEASLKYIIYGSAASGVMLYGMGFLYGVTGTLNVTELQAAFEALKLEALHPQPFFMLATSVLIMAGFAYKIAAVPFHMWCPDVYEGAPTPVTAFFSVGPKAAGFAMLGRFLMGAFGTNPETYPFEWTLVIALLAVMTMTIGNLGALHQQNLKRLLAYSSIAHAGVILLAFTVLTEFNLASAMFYIVVYMLMNLGAFLVLVILEEQFGVETVEGCRGLGWRAPGLCVLMTVFLFSLTGLPPTAGFWGKLYIFAELIKTGQMLSITLCIIAVIFTVISLYYYMRIVVAMFLNKPREGALTIPIRPVFSILLLLLGIAVIGFGIFPNALLELAQSAASHFLK